MSQEEISPDKPASPIDLRWRLADAQLPMRERHLRSLGDLGLTPPMQSWMRTRLEFVLETHAPVHPNGVLHISMDDEGKTKFDVEPACEVPPVLASDLVIKDDEVVGVGMPGVVWVVGDEKLTAATSGKLIDATATTIRDLAQTLHMSVEEHPVQVAQCLADGVEVFVSNDEFGVIPVDGHGGATCDKFKELLDKLLRPSK